MSNPIPKVDLALIEYLDKMYPDALPDMTVPMEVVRFKSGQAFVVRHLKKLYQEQNENILGDSS